LDDSFLALLSGMAICYTKSVARMFLNKSTIKLNSISFPDFYGYEIDSVVFLFCVKYEDLLVIINIFIQYLINHISN
jgi:hypothetical protein